MTRTRVWIVSLASLAAILALLWTVCSVYSTQAVAPGALKGDLRARIVDTSLRLDSLEHAANLNQAYLENIRRVFEDVPTENRESAAPSVHVTDSLLCCQ